MGRIKQVCRLFNDSVNANDLSYVHVILHKGASPQLIDNLHLYSDKILAISMDFNGMVDDTAQRILETLPRLTCLRRIETRFLIYLSETARNTFYDSIEQISQRGDGAPSSITVGLQCRIGELLRTNLSSTLRVCTLDVADLQHNHRPVTWNVLHALFLIFPPGAVEGIASMSADSYPLVRKLTAKILTMGFRTEIVFLRFLNVVELTIDHDHPSDPPQLPTMPNLRQLTCNLGTARFLAFHHQPSLVNFEIRTPSGTAPEETDSVWDYVLELDEEMWSLSTVVFTPLWKKITLKDIKKTHLSSGHWNNGSRNVISTWSKVLTTKGVTLLGGDDIALCDH